MYELIGYLILCPLAFAIGFTACYDMIAKQEERELPLRETIMRYQIDEAYRAGQKNPAPGFYMDAPAPALTSQAEDSKEFSRNCSLEPLFPDPEKAQSELRKRRRIKTKRIAGIWHRS